MIAAPPAPGADRLLRLRPSVSFAPVEHGILFKDWERSFTITGNRSLYALFERLLPHFERGFERGALLGALPEAARGVVAMLLDRLDEHRMWVAVASDPPDGADAFPQALAYLEAVAADPYRAFAQVRAARIAAVGSGGALFAAIRALAGMGVGRIDCWTAPDDAAAIEACLRVHPVAGEVRPVGGDPAAAASGDADLWLQLADRAAPEAIARVAMATDRPLLQGAVGDGVAVAGPLRTGGGPGLADALARLRRPFTGGGPVAPVLAALLGNAVAFEAFRYLAGLTAADGRAVLVTGDPLAVSHHPIVALGAAETVPPAPDAARDAAALSAALAEMREVAAPPERQVAVDRLRELADDEFGILALPHPGELPQLPIFTQRATARGAARDAIGYGDDPTEAYLRAGIEALRGFAQASAPAELPVVALAAPAGAERMPRSAMVLAAGDSHDAWLRDGVAACLARRLTDPAAAGPPVVVQRVGHADLAGRAALRWKTLALRFGQRVAALHGVVAGVPGIHLAAVIAGGATAGIATGASRDAAIEAALREATARAALAEVGVALPEHPRVTAEPAADRAVSAEPDGARDAADSIADSIGALAARGFAVRVHPFCGTPTLRRRGFLLGWVGLRAG